MIGIWTLLISVFTSAKFRELLRFFLTDLRQRRCDDLRLLEEAQRIMGILEKTADADGKPLPGGAKYTEAFNALLSYATALGLDAGEAGIDTVIQFVLPSVREHRTEKGEPPL